MKVILDKIDRIQDKLRSIPTDNSGTIEVQVMLSELVEITKTVQAEKFKEIEELKRDNAELHRTRESYREHYEQRLEDLQEDHATEIKELQKDLADSRKEFNKLNKHYTHTKELVIAQSKFLVRHDKELMEMWD